MDLAVNLNDSSAAELLIEEPLNLAVNLNSCRSCVHCKGTWFSVEAFVRHYRQMHPQHSLICPTCSNRFTHLRLMDWHNEREHYNAFSFESLPEVFGDDPRLFEGVSSGTYFMLVKNGINPPPNVEVPPEVNLPGFHLDGYPSRDEALVALDELKARISREEKVRNSREKAWWTGGWSRVNKGPCLMMIGGFVLLAALCSRKG